MPSIYCFRLKGKFKDKNIYKFGKTNQINPMIRINNYCGLNKAEKILLISYVENSDLIETKILEQLRINYEFINELGKEYFYCEEEINLHKFIKELEIEYYDYQESEESEEIQESENINEINNKSKKNKSIKFELNGVQYFLSEDNLTWRGLFLIFLNKIFNLLDIDLKDFENNLIKNIKGRSKYFSKNSNELREPKKVFNNSDLFVEVNMSKQKIVKNCQKISELFNVDFRYYSNSNE